MLLLYSITPPIQKLIVKMRSNNKNDFSDEIDKKYNLQFLNETKIEILVKFDCIAVLKMRDLFGYKYN